MVTEIFFKEFHTPNNGIFLRIKDSLIKTRSKFQEIWVVETEGFGKMLLLDGKVMLTEEDEHIYHEMITHPGLSLLPEGMRVLVIGGGDGGTVREVLKHNPASITLVEIDELVIEVSKKFFPSLAGSFNDPRVKIIIGDGVKFVKEAKDSGFDAIVIDSTDPEGPALALFSMEFYRAAKKILTQNSFIVTQSESPFYNKQFIVELLKNLKSEFRYVKNYIASVPTYPAIWSFTYASDSLELDVPPKRKISPTKYYHPNMGLDTTKEIVDEVFGCS